MAAGVSRSPEGLVAGAVEGACAGAEWWWRVLRGVGGGVAGEGLLPWT